MEHKRERERERIVPVLTYLSHEDVCGSGGIVPPSLTSAPDGGESSASHPGGFIPGEKAPVPTG
jgi:hypothetical protein